MTQAKQDAPRDGTEFEAGHHLIIGDKSYRWDNIWAGYEGTGWSHSGIAALQDGSVVFAHPEGHRLVRVLPGGEAQEIHTELTEMHAIVAAPLAGREALWVADNGSRYCHGAPDYDEELNVGRVAALDMEGSIRQEIHCPDLPAYAENRWRPTTVAVDGQTGDIWVGDGYGASLVHCFDAAGHLRFTLDGTEAGKHFASPHGATSVWAGASGRSMWPIGATGGSWSTGSTAPSAGWSASAISAAPRAWPNWTEPCS